MITAGWQPLLKRGVWTQGGETYDSTSVAWTLPMPITVGGAIVGHVVAVEARGDMWWGRVELGARPA